MRYRTSRYDAGKADGGQVFEERFERESATANESSVHLENPIETLIVV